VIARIFGGDFQMYTAIQGTKKIEAAQDQLIRRLKKALPARPETFVIGHMGGNFEVEDLRCNDSIWFAHHVFTQFPIKRNWNAFGLANQLIIKGSNKIVAEVNVALDGESKQVAGLFVQDDSGNILLVHRGKIGGGRKGIGKAAFLAWYEGPIIQYIYTARPEIVESALVVANLGSPDIKKQVHAFVMAVQQFKSKAVEEEVESITDAVLAKKAQDAPRMPKITSIVVESFARDRYVSEYAKRRACGKCDLCKRKAPFTSSNGKAYLECHHIDWLANKVSDSITNTVALCPNCHRKMHIVKDLNDIEALRERARRMLLRPKSST
jgi:5-methylcytosine-specific restriction protein A